MRKLPLILILLFSSCMFEEGRIDIIKLNGGGVKSTGRSTVTSVAIVSDQLVIAGENLDGVTNVRITGPSGFDQTFAIESQSGSNLVANGLSNIAFAVGSVFDLILTDAQGAATHQVTFTLQDGAVTAAKLHDMGAGVGQLLRYDGSTWGPGDLGALSYAGNWDASSATVPNVSPAAGEFYIVSVAGSTDLSGGTGTNSWVVGDWAVWNDVASQWEKVANGSSVTSFNGRSGPVTPATNDYTWAQIDKTSSPIGDLSNVDTTGAGVGSVLKFDGTNWVVGTDDTAGAGSVDSTAITDGSIVDADVNASANIAQSKINNLTTDLAAKLNLSGGTMTGDLTMGSNNIITSGNVDGVDVSALATSVSTNATNIGNNTTAIAGKQNTITTGSTAQYLRGDLSLSTFATDARSAAVLNSTAGSETDRAASVAAMKSYVAANAGSGDITNGGNTTGTVVVIGTNDAQSLRLETNNTPAITIDNGGDVGIGTINPRAKNHLYLASSLGVFTRYGNSTTGATGTDGFDVGIQNDEAGVLWHWENEYIRFGTNSTERMRILASGEVGIGTAGPVSKLDVEGKVTVGPINATAGNTGAIALEELAANGTNSVTFRSPDALAADYTLTMPADDGSSGQVLTTDGSGVLSWTTAGAGGVTNVTASAPLASSGGATPNLTITQANGSTNGYLSSTDWTTFNSKQAAITTGATTQYLRGDLTLATLQDDVRATLLTGFSSGAGTVAATDNILQAVQKLDGNIAANTSALAGKQNTITTGTTLQYLRGDLSLATLDTAVVPENTNLYFTDTRARTAAVVNSTAGSETNQAASVAAMKSYVAANAGAGDLLANGSVPMTGNLRLNGAVGSDQYIQFQDDDVPPSIWKIGRFGTDSNKFQIGFGSPSPFAKILTIERNGNVGIGTTSPDNKLHVEGGEITVSRFGSTPGVAFKRGNGTVLSPTAVTNNDVLGAFYFTGQGATTHLTSSAAKIDARAAEDWSDTTGAANIRFYTRSTNDTTSSNVRMTIQHDGNVGIGTATPNTKLDVNGQTKSGYLAHSSLNTNWDSGNIQRTSVSAGTLTFTSGSMHDGASYVLILTATGTFTLSTAGDVSTWKCLPACPSNQIVASGDTILTIIKAGTTGYLSWGAGYQ